MTTSGSDERLTALHGAARTGDLQAAGLLPLVYAELRELAQARMARLAPDQTLQPTALVHEAYLRVASKGEVAWEGRRHFFFAAARAMRDILVEAARRKAGPSRGGDRNREPLLEDALVFEEPSENVLAVHEAIDELERDDPLKAKIVMLRYFAGLTVAETAEMLELSERSLHRHWRYIRAWLKSRI